MCGSRIHRRALLPLAVVALLAELPAQAQPLRPGREGEVEALFAGVGSGETAGWEVGNIAILSDRIRAEVLSQLDRQGSGRRRQDLGPDAIGQDRDVADLPPGGLA